MTDLEFVLDSADTRVEKAKNKDTGAGAGANAGSRADMVYITTSPLSELVWSPQRGLSVKYAESSSSQKKIPLLWNTDSFSMMVFPSKCADGGEGCSTRNLTEENLNPQQLDQIADSQGLTGPPQIATKMMPTVLEHHRSSSSNDQTSDSLPCDIEILRPDLKQADATSMSTVRTSPEHSRKLSEAENCKVLGFPEVSPTEDSMLAKCGGVLRPVSGSRDEESGHSDLARNNIKSASSKMVSDLPIFNQLGEKCSFNGETTDFRYRSGVGRGSNSQSPKEVKIDIDHVSHIHKPTLMGAVLNKNSNSSSLVKTNQHLSTSTEDSGSASKKERADSHGSFESSNGKELISTGKRARSSEPEMSARGKRLKNEGKENSSSGSFCGLESSFMKWISTIIIGSLGSDQATTSMVLIPQPSQQEGNISSLPISCDKGKDKACRANGFHSIFQALYCPSLKLRDTSTSRCGLFHQRTMRALKEEDASKQLGYGTRHVSDDIAVNVHDAIPVRGERTNNDVGKANLRDEVPKKGERVNDDMGVKFFSKRVNCSNLQVVCHGNNIELHKQSPVSTEKPGRRTAPIEELPLSVVNNECSASAREKLKYNIEGNCYFSTLGSLKSFAHTGFVRPLGLKATAIRSSFPNNPSNFVNDSRSNYPESLWVTRLLPRFSAHVPNSEQCNRRISLTLNRDNCGKVNPPSRNDDVPNSAYTNSKSCCHSECERQSASIRDVSMNPNSCGSKRLDTDKKFKSKLNPSLSSLKFKKSQPMASVFAKRLDALRRLLPPKLPADTISMNAICLFCGTSGHNLKECSELPKSELADLDNRINPCGSTARSSFVCIRCDQLDHWAISCPYVPSNRKFLFESNMSVVSSQDCIRVEGSPENPSGSYDRRIILWTGGRKEHQPIDANQIPQRGNICAKNMDLEVVPTASATNAKETDTVNESHKANLVNLKQSLNSRENETMENLSIPACNIDATEVADSLTEIFETIRKLRLSRSDVMRWIKSRNSHSDLEGFFLRLRLGKRDEDLGGTGYHVARIKGATCGNCVSVNMGDFQSVVDCRFVSNHDFQEDELMAWWTTASRGAGKLASIDELKKKLQERTKLQL